MAISAGAREPFAAYKGEGDPEEEGADARRRYEETRQAFWDPALAAQQRALASARGYGTEAEQMQTAAQQQLRAGLEQTRADLMAGAGGRGISPALGRAAGYAGGQLGQRGIAQARALQAQELAAAQAAEQQMLAQQAGLYMGMAEQRLGQQAAENQALQAYQALAAQQAAAAQQQMGQYAAAGIGAGGALLGQAGGWAGGGQQQTSWTPEYQQQYQQWAETYSDRDLKSGVRVPVTTEEARLINALRAEGARTESALEAAVGRRRPSPEQEAEIARTAAALQQLGAQTEARLGGQGLGAMSAADYRAMGLTPPAAQPMPYRQVPPGLGAMSAQDLQRLQSSSAETDRTLGSLAGAGRQYEYTPQAQQQLGQPAGLQYGPMAQDLAQTRLGRSAVVETPAGLAVDTGRLGLISAGLIGRQQEQIEEIRRQLETEGARTEARLGRATR
jgi:hypothetical protein